MSPQSCQKAVVIISIIACLLHGLHSATGAAGTQFIVGFMENVETQYETVLVIGGNSHSSSNVTVTCPGLTFHRSFELPKQDTVRILLPREVVNIGPVHDTKGILVESSADVTVYGLNAASANAMDGFAALPTRDLGSEYCVISTDVSDQLAPDQRWSEFLLIGVVDDTTVEMHFAAPAYYRNTSYDAGETLQIKISRLETVQLQGQRDLTGTRVVSDRPIVVLSGSKCANIPADVAACDHLVEFALPTNQWGSKYVLSTFLGRTAGDYFRVVGFEQGTRVTIVAPSVGKTTIQLDAGGFHTFELKSSESGYVTSSRPITVAQYSQGAFTDGGTNGDPSMLLVTPVGQWLRGGAAHVTFSSCDVTGGGAKPIRNYLTVTSRCSSSDDVMVDGRPLAVPRELVRMPGFQGEEYFCVMRSPLDLGTHTVSAMKDSAAFGAYVYGFGEHVAYSYPLGSEKPTESFPLKSQASLTDADRGRTKMICAPHHQNMATWIVTGALVGAVGCAVICFAVLRRKFRALTAIQPCNTTGR